MYDSTEYSPEEDQVVRREKKRTVIGPSPRPQETPTRNLTFPLGSRLVPFRNEKILYDSGFSR